MLILLNNSPKTIVALIFVSKFLIRMRFPLGFLQLIKQSARVRSESFPRPLSSKYTVKDESIFKLFTGLPNVIQRGK